jgi:predicted nucleic acid-binding protein
MVSRKVFFDTNILLYSDDPRYPKKRNAAVQLIELHRRSRTGALSTQVLQEYYANATQKLKLDAGLARQRTLFFSRFSVLSPTVDDIFTAIDLHRLHQISFWDAMIVRMAILSGARTLYSEDMQHGRSIDGIEINNPFL